MEMGGDRHSAESASVGVGYRGDRAAVWGGDEDCKGGESAFCIKSLFNLI
jgi:hypothetical protein